MAVQFAPKEESSAANLGSAVGKGLSGLIEKKIADLQKQYGIQERKAAYKNLGLPEYLAELPDDIQQSLIKEYDFLPDNEKQQAKQQLNDIGNTYWSDWTSESQQEEPQQEQPTLPIQLQKPGLQLEQGQQPNEEQLGQARKMLQQAPLQGGIDSFLEGKKSTIPGLNSLATAGDGFVSQQRMPVDSSQSFPELGQGLQGQPSPMPSAMPTAAKKETSEKQTSPFRAVRKGSRALSINPEIELEKLRRASYKETKPEREAFLQEYQSAKNVMADLERMEELQKEGKLDTPGYIEFLNRSGLDIPALSNEGSEEFNKIAANFLREAKNYYGGRVSNYEVEQFLKTVPSLSQSPEGRKRVIANLKRMNRAKLERYQVYKDIKQQNHGVIPPDIAEQVEDRLDKRLDYLAKQFKDDLKKKVPAGQNKLITATQAIAGSTLGVPGKILGAVGKLFSTGAV